MTDNWPTEVRLSKDRKTLTVTFDGGDSFALPAEYLRVKSPSARNARNTVRYWLLACGVRNTQDLKVSRKPAYSALHKKSPN